MIKSSKYFKALIGKSLLQLEEICAKIDTYYYIKKEIKLDKFGKPKLKNGQPVNRILMPSKGELKTLQTILNKRVFSKIAFPTCVYGSVKGKSNITNALQHKGKVYKFLTDLRDFYPSITSKMVYDALIVEGFSPDIARLVTKLTTYKNQLPQGTPTSPIVANIVFKKVDLAILKTLENKNITYTRYVDDLTFSSKDNFQYLHCILLKHITDFGLNINRKKTNYKKGITDITGVQVKNNIIKETHSFKKKLERADLPEISLKGCLAYKARIRSFNTYSNFKALL